MIINFLRELREIWSRQHISWRTVVTRQVFNRFFNQMTMQYSNIYIRELGASPVKFGAVNSASGLSSTIISLPLGFLQDLYSVRKIFLFDIILLPLVPLLYTVAYRWEFNIPTIINICLRLPLLYTIP